MRNLYRVPKKQWNKWSGFARKVFNEVYSFGMNNTHIMLHPKGPQPSSAQFKTTSWNFAWIAADAVDDSIPDEVKTV